MPSKIKEIIKSLYEEGCVDLEYMSANPPPDFEKASILADGVKKYAMLLAIQDAENQRKLIFEQLLHPIIVQSSYQQFLDGHLRDAVLNAIIAVFDLIRIKSGLDLDGDTLVTHAFSVGNPKLIVGDLSTQNGKNIQSGFMRILQGAYQSIRNPQAHTMKHDLDENKAKQYLVFASLLARYIEESVLANQ